MSRKEKLLRRFRTLPKDFTWEEMCALLNHLGFKDISGSGSRNKFMHEKTMRIISIHKPHPGNVMKQYVMRQVRDQLTEDGLT